MTIKQLEARGWEFFQSHAEKHFLGAVMIVPYDKNNSPAKVAKAVSEVDATMQTVTENAAKWETLKGLLS